MRSVLLACAAILASCTVPQPSGVKAIVGARLEAGNIEYSVVVVAEGKFRAVGPQATTAVPKGSHITDGKGRVIRESIEVGGPADLLLRNAATGSVEASMKNGEWVK